MAAKIFPSVLGLTPRQFTERLRMAKKLQRPLHLDVMDGRFVKTQSLGPLALAKLSIPRRHEVHVMVQEPLRWLDALKKIRTPLVIIPVEIGRHLPSIISQFQDNHIHVALSINPTTSTARLRPWCNLVRRIHVMTVNPGGYGGPFRRAMVTRIARLHRQYPRLVISCDGGLNQRTIPLVRAAGASIFIVGSAIMADVHPGSALRRLEQLL